MKLFDSKFFCLAVALVEAASARLASSETRVVPCAAQTSEQYSQDG